MKRNILIIDDDEKLNSLLTEYLSKFGLIVTSSTRPEKGLQLLNLNEYDLVILDVMLPGMDGFQTCREIRKETNIPIIMLTARGEVTDRIVGLELGADDYLPKPFEPRELAARIQSILRRSSEKTRYRKKTIGNMIVDLDRQSVILGKKTIDLTTMEFELLALFVKHSGKVLMRDRIIESLRGLEWEAFDRSVDVLLSRLRQKLGDDPKNPRWIKTVWGSGYKFIGEESEE
jgi:two-component system phosphate regulon response regulator OmpR